jgi:arginase
MLEAGIIKQLEELEWKVHERTVDIDSLKPEEDEPVGLVKNPRYVGAVTKEVAREVKDITGLKHFALTLGGDHSLGLGTLAGVLDTYPDVGIIWVDAHAVWFGVTFDAS